LDLIKNIAFKLSNDKIPANISMPLSGLLIFLASGKLKVFTEKVNQMPDRTH